MRHAVLSSLIATLGMLFFVSGSILVSGASGYAVNANGGRTQVNEWGTCRNVLSYNASRIFVPTNSDAEWTAARNAFGGGSVPSVYIGACNACAPSVPNFEVVGCTEFWESYDVTYTDPEACMAACASMNADGCFGVGGGGGPYCKALSGSCTLATHAPLFGSVCGYR